MSMGIDPERLHMIRTARFDHGRGWIGLPDSMTEWERKYWEIFHSNEGFMFEQWGRPGKLDTRWLLDEIFRLVKE